jgi:hypothetical protein
MHSKASGSTAGSLGCLPSSESPPAMAPRGLPSPPPLPPLPVGALERHLSFEQCFIHRSEEVVAAKHVLQLALVTIISGNRPPVSMDQVCHWIQEHYDIPSDSVTVQHFQPEDFLITFSFYDDMLCVLHNPLPQDASFVLVFKSWACQLRATAMKLFYHIITRLRGIPANARHLSTARQILSPGCSKVQLANSAEDDVRSLIIHAKENPLLRCRGKWQRCQHQGSRQGALRSFSIVLRCSHR